MVDMPKKFSLVETIEAQMKRFSEIRETDPSKARKMFERGDMLVEYAKSGAYRKFKILVDLSEIGDLLWFFAVKAFKQALVNDHLMIAQYMIDNGYPITNPTLPLILNECLLEVADHQGANLVDYFAIKGYDVNSQVSPADLI